MKSDSEVKTTPVGKVEANQGKQKQDKQKPDVLIHWLNRHGKKSHYEDIKLADMEGWVVGEGIGSPYYLIEKGRLRLVPTIEQAMGYGAVEFLSPDEMAKIPKGRPLQ